MRGLGFQGTCNMPRPAVEGGAGLPAPLTPRLASPGVRGLRGLYALRPGNKAYNYCYYFLFSAFFRVLTPKHSPNSHTPGHLEKRSSLLSHVVDSSSLTSSSFVLGNFSIAYIFTFRAESCSVT